MEDMHMEPKKIDPNWTVEVLHGIELTPDELAIWVATGGCTEKCSFWIYVDKGFTGKPPYIVTVFRVKPDDCKGSFQPIRLCWSRKELGLEGLAEFTLSNRIGNTSQHR
jgi:hypothetical protein